MFRSQQPLRKPSNIKQEIIFVIGGPGSGKGTHCARLVENKGYVHLSTGDLVRNFLNDSNSEDENPTIKLFRDTIKSGGLLDDEMIITLLRHEMSKYPRALGFLIDGCPRTLNQVRLFEEQIKPCNKVLYFDTTEEIMKQRILKRGLTEQREDDNEVTALRRIQVYRDKTLPVVEYLRKTKGSIFKHIDSSGALEEVSRIVDETMRVNPIEKVSYIEFLKLYLAYGNFYDAVDELQNRHGGASDFEVVFAYMTMFYIIQNKEDVKRLLTANTVTGYQNHNFEAAHGHDLNINATQAFLGQSGTEKNPIWENIHKGLGASVGDKNLINTLIAKHIRQFFTKPQFMLDLAFEDFMLKFWCEYLFGPKVNADEFKTTRAKLLAALTYAYYGNRFKSTPYLGNLTCRFYGYMKQDEFRAIDQELQKFIDAADDGLIYRFKQYLQKSESFPQDKVTQAVLDNTLDFILVYDFIHNAMYETLAEIVRNNLDSTNQRKRAYSQGLANAFLFPFRVRVPQEDLALESVKITRGVPTYINLVKAGLYHSFGPRACIGTGITDWIKDAIWNHLEGMQLRTINTSYPAEREALSHNRDVPVSPERYEVMWQYPRHYLQKALPKYPFKGVDEFYDVMKIFENPVLFGYIVRSFIESINKQNIDKTKLCIVSPEVRGIPVAAAVAHALEVPLVIIRKPGKIPGSVLSHAYSTAYSKDELQISTTSDVKDRHIVLIDDGIASGGTTLACCDLIKRLGGEIKLVLAMINHTYKAKPAELSDYTIQTVFDFKNNAVNDVKPNETVTSQKMGIK